MTHVAHDGTDLLALMKGGNYRYYNVPVNVFEGFLTADSAGKYLNAEIKPNFGYGKLEAADPIIVQILTHPSPRLPGLYDAMAQAGAEAREAEENLIIPKFNNWGTKPVDIVILDPNIEVKYAKPGDAAFDLMARIPEPIWIEAGQHKLIPSGLKIQLHPGLAGLVLPRSGLSNKLRVSVVNSPGLIDSQYTGEVGILVENRGAAAFPLNPYDKVAQFMIVPAITPIFRVVDELQQTERGEGGFGSTGVAKNETNGV
jgi:dUTP pyrophosphatase